MDDVISRDCLFGRPFVGVAIYVKQSLAGNAKLYRNCYQTQHHTVVCLQLTKL